jgi:hypothetical protein
VSGRLVGSVGDGERLEEWWLDNASHNLATLTIGPIGMEWSNCRV